jgi:Holliday junction resolvase RusA-like endonuclease
MSELKLVVPGIPIAKARPRFFRRGKFVGTYNCQETEEGKFAVLCKNQIHQDPLPAGQSIQLSCRFFMPIPAGWSQKKRRELDQFGISHVKKPDLDNMVKFIKDCLNGIAWHDDSQITCLFAEKEYSYNPRTEIIISWEYFH